MNITGIGVISSAVLALLCASLPGRADEAAERLLQKAEAATQAANTITAEYTNIISNARGPYYGWKNSLKLLKPNLCRLDIRSSSPDKTVGADKAESAWITTDSALIVSDGKTRWQYGYRRNDYKKSSIDAKGKDLNLVDIRPLVDFFDPARSWWSQAQALRKEGRLKELSLAGSESWEGADYQIVQQVSVSDTFYTDEQLKAFPGGVPLKTDRFYIGKDDLVHRIVETGTQGLRFDFQLHDVKVGVPLHPEDFAYHPPADAKPAAPPPPLLSPGKIAPEFIAESKNGAIQKLSDYKGKIVVLDFWATWCQPCQKALPHLRKVYDAVQGQDVVFLALCVWDDRKAFDAWLTRNTEKYPFVFGFDPAGRSAESSIARKLYSVNGIPATYVLDRDGKIAASFDDYIEGDTRLETALRKLRINLPEPKPSEVKEDATTRR